MDFHAFLANTPRVLFSALLFAVLVVSAKDWAQGSAVPAAAGTQKSSDFDADNPVRQQAFQLYDKHKMSEAAPLLEKVVAQYPRDVRAHEALGVALLSRADTLSDPAQRKAERVHARNELLHARDLGDNSDLCKVLLAGIPEDGSETVFSGREEVDGAMQRGEAAFANGEWDTAIKEYSRALELDPKLYLAAVDIGDTYFRLKEMDRAGEWFAKATAIDPNQETAYRYWGDALLSQGKMQEAREKYIQGVVAFPYKGGSGSWGGLHNWVSRNKVQLKDISIRLPQAPSKNAKGDTVITIDPSMLGKEADSGAAAAWIAYSGERALWRSANSLKSIPRKAPIGIH